MRFDLQERQVSTALRVFWFWFFFLHPLNKNLSIELQCFICSICTMYTFQPYKLLLLSEYFYVQKMNKVDVLAYLRLMENCTNLTYKLVVFNKMKNSLCHGTWNTQRMVSEAHRLLGTYVVNLHRHRIRVEDALFHTKSFRIFLSFFIDIYRNIKKMLAGTIKLCIMLLFSVKIQLRYSQRSYFTSICGIKLICQCLCS